MANDFPAVLSELVAGTLNSHPNTSALMAASLVRQLANLQPEVVPWMELSGSFATVANQATYTSAVTGFPKGYLRFERLGYDMGAYYRPLEVVDMLTIRELQELPAMAYPWRIAIFEGKLQFGPAPVGVYTVKWDITLDATVDQATGALITTASSTGISNPWFLLPQVSALKHLAWADYYLTSPDQRPDLGQTHQQFAAAALARAREAGQKKEEMSQALVTPNAFDAYQTRSPAARLSRLFPGAPA